MRWLVFDYGEVISRRTDAVPGMASVLGAPVAEFEQAYWAERESIDRGRPNLEYWQAVGERVHRPVDAELSATLSTLDHQGWLHTDPGTLALLEELDEAGTPLALLSNAPSSFGRVAEQQPWARHFRHLLFSGDLGIAKPDPEIWKALTELLHEPAGNCLFVDDRQVNVDGARAAGLQAELWSSPARLRARFAEFSATGGVTSGS
jgi:putative hydrolase of the HAD superfamily